MGPLQGLKIIEFAGIGPGPMCAMLFADLGATVLRIERKTPAELGLERPARFDVVMRSRKQIALDLKDPAAVAMVFALLEKADGLIEGFRPGVMERLGLGPEPCLAHNARLVYGRMTGWGQEGPLAESAGHDLNYIALTGALAAIGRSGAPPTPPLNLVGDYGGGALYLAVGMLAAVFEALRSGQGQVVDAAIVDGTAHMMAPFFELHAAGLMSLERGSNILDSGAPYYDVYECADGKFVTLAPIEARFFDELMTRLGLDGEGFVQSDWSRWGALREAIAGRIRTRSRDEWSAILAGTDACFAPVLTLAEAPAHPHMAARAVYAEIDGLIQPNPAPRFSRTRPAPPTPPRQASETPVEDALLGWGVDHLIADWRATGAIV